MSASADEKYLRVSKVAQRLDVTTQTVRKYIACGKLQAKRLPGRGHWRITEASLQALLREITRDESR